MYPQLLLVRLLFSIGGAATATMVTAILPSMTAVIPEKKSRSLPDHNEHMHGRTLSPSVSSELTITPARSRIPSTAPYSKAKASSHKSSPTRLAGFVGVFTGLGALLALGLFLPLPARFQNLHIRSGQAIAYTYYVVGFVAILVALFCFIGLRNLNGEEEKGWRMMAGTSAKVEGLLEKQPQLTYWKLLLESIRLGYQHPLIGLGYLGGFVARASSVGISLFIPLFVNAYYISSGKCKDNFSDEPTDTQTHCREAYVLAAQLTGTSQLVALLVAPVFGYLADRYRRFHVPLLTAAFIGVLGYAGFALLDSPKPSGANGNPVVFVIVSLLGISQIGCIVGSLGLLGRGILGLEMATEFTESTHILDSDIQDDPSTRGSSDPYYESTIDDAVAHDISSSTSYEDRQEIDSETQGLLHRKLSKNYSLNHLKGSIAGMYSLAGGAGILLLTKLGGFLFDRNSPTAPFYLLASFNALLLLVGVISALLQIMRFSISAN